MLHSFSQSKYGIVPGSEVIKLFMGNSTEHEIYLADKC